MLIFVSKAHNPTEESVLNALSWTFKAAKAYDEMLECYERAYERQPNNHDLAVELFYCYVRLREPKKQQPLAMKIFKATDQHKYVFWSVTSILQQSDGVLVLAERMLKKVAYESPSASPVLLGAEECFLYIEVHVRGL